MSALSGACLPIDRTTPTDLGKARAKLFERVPFNAWQLHALRELIAPVERVHVSAPRQLGVQA